MPLSTKLQDQDALSLDRQICFALYAASNLIGRKYGPALARLDLTYPQYLVMLVLWEAEPQSVGAIGGRLYLDSGTLTPLLKRMAAAGLVTRTRDPADERRVMIGLTGQGRDLRERAVHLPATIADGCRPEDVEELRDHVRRLVTILSSAPRCDREAVAGETE